MHEKQLAITSIPMQEWGPIYPDSKALKKGTIFEELDLPFYAAETCGCGQERNSRKSVLSASKEQEREELMTRVYEVGFVLDDLTLYLDTHPEDEEALKMFLEKSRERAKLKKEFAEKFYPLTRDCVVEGQNMTGYCWMEGPMPWEGACV